jgi:hypothetical protein
MKNRFLANLGATRVRLPLVLRRSAGAAALVILASSSAFPQGPARSDKKYDIEFVKVVDTTHGFSSFKTFPSLNNHGDVAFVAVKNGTGEGVFKARAEGEAVITIASAMDSLSFFGDDVAINAGGIVAFDATTSTGSQAIFTGDGASKKVIADSITNRLFKIGVGSPSINAAGMVAFESVRGEAGFPSSVFTGNGGPLTTVASTSATGFGGFGNAAINDSGTVVFRGILNDGNEGVFTVRNSLTDIVDSRIHPEFFGFGDPVINNSGTVADVAFLTTQAPEIISSNGKGITARSDPNATPALANSEHPSINNQGAVAFFAFANTPGSNSPTGIFLEVSGGHSLIPVIKPGDKLFGSTVARVDLGRFALNDRFQMAFSYSLTDGRAGIAIASFNGEGEGDDQ